MLDDVPDFHINPPHPAFDDVPAPASFWRILARHSQFLEVPLDEVVDRFGRDLLECRPCEGLC
jgi:hypothetical protein